MHTEGLVPFAGGAVEGGEVVGAAARVGAAYAARLGFAFCIPDALTGERYTFHAL